jgi:hypothetical protein
MGRSKLGRRLVAVVYVIEENMLTFPWVIGPVVGGPYGPYRQVRECQFVAKLLFLIMYFCTVRTNGSLSLPRQ